MCFSIYVLLLLMKILLLLCILRKQVERRWINNKCFLAPATSGGATNANTNSAIIAAGSTIAATSGRINESVFNSFHVVYYVL